MLDRTVAPPINFDPTINKLEYSTHILSSDIPVYYIQDNQQSVVGIEIVFGGAKLHEVSNGASYFSTQLLKSGINNLDANALNEFFELRGAFVQIQNGLDSNSFNLYCLSEKLNEVLPLFLKLFKEPVFPQYQIDKLKKKKGQEIDINEQKTNYWASKLVKESLFGNHAYGQILSKEDINSLTRSCINDHWNTLSLPSVDMITIAGSFNINQIIDIFEPSFHTHNQVSDSEKNVINSTLPKFNTKELINSNQSSLKIGMQSIKLTHKDYPTFSLSNTILGGYFGSRLMQSIREDKGLTYGINSSLVHLQESSYLVISADLKKGAGKEVINLINTELDKLSNQKISEDELIKVKNYIISKYKSETETVFDKINKVKFLKSNKLSDTFFTSFHKTLLESDSSSINTVVKNLINTDNFHTVIVE